MVTVWAARLDPRTVLMLRERRVRIKAVRAEKPQEKPQQIRHQQRLAASFVHDKVGFRREGFGHHTDVAQLPHQRKSTENDQRDATNTLVITTPPPYLPRITVRDTTP